jgi:hypothetical protein
MPRRRIVLLAALLLGLTFVTTAAYAAQTSGPTATRSATLPQRKPWPWPVICTQAKMTRYQAKTVDGQTVISLAGSLTPCPGVTDPGAYRSFTLYSGTTAYLGKWPAPMRDRTTGSYDFKVSGTRAYTVNAVCVIDGLKVLDLVNGHREGIPHRKACIGITYTAKGPVAAPIPLTDRATQHVVMDPVTHSDGDPGGLPSCVNCL